MTFVDATPASAYLVRVLRSCKLAHLNLAILKVLVLEYSRTAGKFLNGYMN
eukprot:SAG31_NODE_95_length_25901_cov_24.763700_29_plen_51_part_00